MATLAFRLHCMCVECLHYVNVGELSEYGNIVMCLYVCPCGRSMASHAFAALNVPNTPDQPFNYCDNVLLFRFEIIRNFEFSRMMDAFDLHQCSAYIRMQNPVLKCVTLFREEGSSYTVINASTNILL